MARGPPANFLPTNVTIPREGPGITHILAGGTALARSSPLKQTRDERKGSGRTAPASCASPPAATGETVPDSENLWRNRRGDFASPDRTACQKAPAAKFPRRRCPPGAGRRVRLRPAGVYHIQGGR